MTRRKRQRDERERERVRADRRQIDDAEVPGKPLSRRASNPAVAPPRRARWARSVLVVLSVLYLAGLWLEGVGSQIPQQVLPRPLLFFVQAAQLFTRAGAFAIDYRAEAWLCDEQRWHELDTRPYFRINRDDKESRFHRTLHFHRRERVTMQALERYLIDSYAKRGADAGLPPGARVGGVRFLSLRKPIPEPGRSVARYRRLPLADHPEEQHKHWYWTPLSRREARCGEVAPTPGGDA